MEVSCFQSRNCQQLSNKAATSPTFIWNDEAFNMVEFQEEMKYGRSSGISLGGVDFVKLAESFGGKGFRISDSSEIDKVMDEAIAHKGVSLVDVKIDYSHARDLAGNLIQDSIG